MKTRDRRQEAGDKRQETRDRNQETGTCIKKVMGKNFFLNPSQWRNFYMVQLFLGGAKIKWHGAAMAQHF